MQSGETAEITEALNLLKAGGFKTGPEWEKAHEIAQAHEGEAAFDWIHALCHRIEGDDWNADYWYRRAGKARGEGDIAEEWRQMREKLNNEASQA